MEEVWKDVIGYEGLYLISNLGRLKRLYKGRPERIIKPVKGSFGYMFYSFGKNCKIKTFRIHRLVAIHFVPNPNNYTEVNHIDGNKENCADWNLEWCTRSHNIKHAFRLGLKTVAEKDKQRFVRYLIKRENNPLCKKVINIETGVIYDSIKEAAMKNNIVKTTLVARLNGTLINNTPLRIYGSKKNIQ